MAKKPANTASTTIRAIRNGLLLMPAMLSGLLRPLTFAPALLPRFPLDQVLLGDRQDGAKGVAHSLCIGVTGDMRGGG
jgi:hypothetical protein